MFTSWNLFIVMIAISENLSPCVIRVLDNIQSLKQALAEADAVVVGAGAGLSTSAGFVYSGERFEKYFSDFAEKYRFTDMYSGGFYPFPSKEEFLGILEPLYLGQPLHGRAQTAL